MRTFKSICLTIFTLVLGVVMSCGYVFAEGDTNYVKAADGQTIHVKCYKDFTDYGHDVLYQTIDVPYGTSDISGYINAPLREYCTFIRWRFFDVNTESFNVDKITGENIIVYGVWSDYKPVSSEADTSSEDSEFAKLTCYLDYDSYKSGISYGSVNIKKAYNAESILDVPRRDNYIFYKWVFIDGDGNPTDSMTSVNKSAYAEWLGPVPSSGVSEDTSSDASVDASGNPLVKITYYETFDDYKRGVPYKELYVGKSIDLSSVIANPERESYKFKYWNYVQNGVLVDDPLFNKRIYAYGEWQGPISEYDSNIITYTNLRDYSKTRVRVLKSKKKQIKVNVFSNNQSNIGVKCKICYWIKGKSKNKKTVTFDASSSSHNTQFTLKKLKSKKKYCVKARVEATYKDVEYVSKWSKTVTCKTK